MKQGFINHCIFPPFKKKKKERAILQVVPACVLPSCWQSAFQKSGLLFPLMFWSFVSASWDLNPALLRSFMCKRKDTITLSEVQDPEWDLRSRLYAEFVTVIHDIKRGWKALPVPQAWDDSSGLIPSSLQLRSRCRIQPTKCWLKAFRLRIISLWPWTTGAECYICTCF